MALGALLTNLNPGVPAVTVLGIVCGNALEALTGAFLLRRVADFRPSLERVLDASTMTPTALSRSTGMLIPTGPPIDYQRSKFLGDTCK